MNIKNIAGKLSPKSIYSCIYTQQSQNNSYQTWLSNLNITTTYLRNQNHESPNVLSSDSPENRAPCFLREEFRFTQPIHRLIMRIRFWKLFTRVLGWIPNSFFTQKHINKTGFWRKTETHRKLEKLRQRWNSDPSGSVPSRKSINSFRNRLLNTLGTKALTFQVVILRNQLRNWIQSRRTLFRVFSRNFENSGRFWNEKR